MSKQTPNSIVTWCGQFLDITNIDPNVINAIDIWNGLSKECRFGNQIEDHYSVAQHSVILSQIVPEPYQRYALLHDASEAFLHDIPSPYKQLMRDYQSYEAVLQCAIEHRFLDGVSVAVTEVVSRYDRALRIPEAEALGAHFSHDPEILRLVDLPQISIQPVEHDEAYDLIKARWQGLGIPE